MGTRSGNVNRLLVLPLLFLSMVPVSSTASPPGGEAIVVELVLNLEPSGERFAWRTGEGEILLLEEDLESLGIAIPPGRSVEAGGDRYVPLRAIGGAESSFDEGTLTLHLTVPPERLPKRTIDLMPPRQPRVFHPEETAAFLNYSLGYTDGDAPGREVRDGALEFGGRHGKFLLLGDFSYEGNRSRDALVRLSTALVHDRRDTMRRTSVGDLFAASGELGATLNLGGVGVSKVYRIDPYFLRYPLARLSGVTRFPSEAEVYLDGTRIRSQKLRPGEFELQNLSYYGGATDLTIRVRDPFGNVQELSYPFYFTDLLLRKGLHEYSYNAGFLREEFGTRSNDYGDLAVSLFHRYGVSDRLTAAFRGEGTGDGLNGGPAAAFLFPRAGVTSLSVSGSYARDGGNGGVAGLLRHEYQDRRFGGRAFLKGYSRNYYLVSQEGDRPDLPGYEGGLSLGYSTPRFGSLTLEYSARGNRGSPDRNLAGVAYSRNLFREVRAFLSYRRVEEEVAQDEWFAGITWYPWADWNVSAGYEARGSGDLWKGQVQKNAPVGEGFGFRATAEREESGRTTVTRINPYLQWNSKYAILTGEYRGTSAGSENGWTGRVAVSGALAAVGGSFGATRPIGDSFGLVRVDRLEGVRVYHNGQEVGRTGRKGELLVPSLSSYYENQVSIADRDVPIDYSLAEVARYVSPPLRSGSVVGFESERFQAATGFLRGGDGGADRPLEYVEAKVLVDGKEILFPTGTGGEFYLENLPPGEHEGSAPLDGERCAFRLRIPVSPEMIVEVGEVRCETAR